ncbi:hypothetical protein HY504_00485 [Candidatus Wolfebacteria bacterium]|nr:hypothetical protein [Candidatus Wolfebacteria bacterium]
MYNFIFEIGFFLGLGTMIYLVARAVPRVGDDLLADEHHSGLIDRLIARIPMEKLDEMSSRFLLKMLRRTRLVILRLDNLIGKSLEKVKRSNNNSSTSLRASGNGNGNGKATLFTNREEKEE